MFLSFSFLWVLFPGKVEYAGAHHGIFYSGQPRNKSSNGGASMLSLLWTAVIGLVVGALAKFILPGKDPGGILVTMILGIAGSFLGTFLGRLIGHYQEGQSAGFIMSLIGAIILLAIYHFFKRRQVV
ncbi:MAG TPA: GlsB/YeaQ/YmgE family stress response membrane protein [Edaphobacter sp.]|jgi:uncharacterized membrane protein YeaQ/YmgE (transglycosylase-associated protein family)